MRISSNEAIAKAELARQKAGGWLQLLANKRAAERDALTGTDEEKLHQLVQSLDAIER